ncbi:hypothetical protein U6A24_02475 [Aquimarina gracilis]|uniref:Uncharacterized protein n=1 Tax=Aquimarina gracilis TaxID=874422 RepID=A0ABU5ZQF6_9FLAO|nr:hypothetical protein [Aquimarina gracilis]MEB3344305.1 hypothetical protein [Aquimarina gracilis]
MINFDELEISGEGDDTFLTSEKWNGLLRDVRSFFDAENDINLGDHKLSLGSGLADTKLALYKGGTVYGLGIQSNRFTFNLGHNGAKYAFYNKDSDPKTEIFTIEGEGNIGIGDSNPNHKLSLGTDSADVKIALYENGGNVYGLGYNSSKLTFNIGSSGGRYAFYNDNNGTSRKEIFTIKGNGHVGINHTNPGVPLEVKGRIFGDNIGALDFMDTPHIKTKKVQSHNNILQINPEGNPVQIGRNREELALDIRGHVRVLGETPIQIHRITGVQSGVDKLIKHGTKSFNDSEYNACVVGYKSSIHNGEISVLRIKRKSGKYYIESVYGGNHTIDVDVMITRFGISFATGN